MNEGHDMEENNYYHGPIFPEMRESIKGQFHIGDIVEVSDLGSDGHSLKGFKKIRILEKWKHFLVAEGIDPTPSGYRIRECYTYTDLATVMYARPCMAVLR